MFTTIRLPAERPADGPRIVFVEACRLTGLLWGLVGGAQNVKVSAAINPKSVELGSMIQSKSNKRYVTKLIV
jgi:hypothetical protein